MSTRALLLLLALLLSAFSLQPSALRAAGAEAVTRDPGTKVIRDYATAGIVYARYDLTGLTGGGATNLDGVTTAGLPTAGLPTGATYDLVISGTASRYRLRAGTDAESAPDIVRPDDYHASTNARVWELIEIAGGGGSGTGDIESVTAGDGLTGGGTSGAVTLNIVGATSGGITVNADSIQVNESEVEALLDLQDLQGQITGTQIADSAIQGGDGGEIEDESITAADLGADSVGASELNAAAVAAELEAVLELQNLQGAVTDAQVPAVLTLDGTTADDLRHTVTAHGSTGSAETFDFASSSWHTATLDANCTFTLSNLAAGSRALLQVTQDGTGGRTITWPGSVASPAPALNATANSVTTFVLYTADGATIMVSGANPLDPDADGVVADAQVSDTITVGASGSVHDSAIPSGITRDAEAAAAYQPLESTLTDIADGTIAEDLVNTAHPWADNEVADDITITGYVAAGTVDASGFDGNLATTDNTVQEIAQKLDDLTTGGAPEVVDEAYSAGNFDGGTTSAVSQDDFYDYNHIADTDDDGLPQALDADITLGTGASTVTGGAGNMTITAGTGNSRTMTFRTTTSGGTATTAMTLGADQSGSLVGNLTVQTGIIHGTSSDIQLRDSGGTNFFRSVRTTLWGDSATGTFFQVGSTSGNTVFTTQNGVQAGRTLVTSNFFQVLANQYTGATTPTRNIEFLNSSNAIFASFDGARSKSSWTTTGAQFYLAAQTFTDSSTSASGTAASAVFSSFAQPTLAATNSSVTTTDAATVYIANAPAAGTNMTITRPWALWIDDGNARFDGGVTMNTTGVTSAAGVRTAFIPVGWMEDGATPPAALETYADTRKVDVRSFSNATTQDLESFWQIPADALDGNSGTGDFQLKWRPIYLITESTAPASGEGVTFGLAAASVATSEDFGATLGTEVDSAIADLNGHAQGDIVYGPFVEVTVTGGAAGEGMVFQLRRDTADSNDDYAQVVKLIGIEIKFAYQLGTAY